MNNSNVPSLKDCVLKATESTVHPSLDELPLNDFKVNECILVKVDLTGEDEVIFVVGRHETKH